MLRRDFTYINAGIVWTDPFPAAIIGPVSAHSSLVPAADANVPQRY